MEIEDEREGTAVCYNHIWESISEQKVALMDCFSTSPKNTHGSSDVDSIINVSRSVCLYSIVTYSQLLLGHNVFAFFMNVKLMMLSNMHGNYLIDLYHYLYVIKVSCRHYCNNCIAILFHSLLSHHIGMVVEKL